MLDIAPPYIDPATGALGGSTRVFKVGRTTGYTEGEVAYVGGVTMIEYEPGDWAYFTDQIMIRATPDNVGPFSDSGDSGSAILNDRHELVGLLFAGSVHQTIANPIAEVVSQLRRESGITSLRPIVI